MPSRKPAPLDVDFFNETGTSSDEPTPITTNVWKNVIESASLDRTLTTFKPEQALPDINPGASAASPIKFPEIFLFRQALLEVPLRVVCDDKSRKSNNKSSTRKHKYKNVLGRLELSGKSRMSVLSQVPLTERWTGTLKGTSVVIGGTGYVSSQLDLQYRLEDWRNNNTNKNNVNNNKSATCDNYLQGGIRLEEQPSLYAGGTLNITKRSLLSAHFQTSLFSDKLNETETSHKQENEFNFISLSPVHSPLSSTHPNELHDSPASTVWRRLRQSSSVTIRGCHSFPQFTVQGCCAVLPVIHDSFRIGSESNEDRQSNPSLFPQPWSPSYGLSLLSAAPSNEKINYQRHKPETEMSSVHPSTNISSESWQLGLFWTPALTKPLCLSTSASKVLNKRNMIMRLKMSWNGTNNWTVGWNFLRVLQSQHHQQQQLDSVNKNKQSIHSRNDNSKSAFTLTKIGAGIVYSPQHCIHNGGTLTWVWTFVFQELTLRLPIALALGRTGMTTVQKAVSSVDAVSPIANAVVPALTSNSFWCVIQVLYLTFLSNVFIDMAAHIVSSVYSKRTASANSGRSPQKLDQPISTEHKPKDNKEQAKLARDEALLQQSLMKRQAKMRTIFEQERNGLVISKAVYYLPTKKQLRSSRKSSSTDSQRNERRGDEKEEKNYEGEKLDVTIPLQFWVSESTLNLVALSKSQLLGFYDITLNRKKTSLPTSQKKGKVQTKRWWTQLWWTAKQRVPEVSVKSNQLPLEASPKLRIEYKYRGVFRTVIIDDQNSLCLPSKQDLMP